MKKYLGAGFLFVVVVGVLVSQLLFVPASAVVSAWTPGLWTRVQFPTLVSQFSAAHHSSSGVFIHRDASIQHGVMDVFYGHIRVPDAEGQEFSNLADGRGGSIHYEYFAFRQVDGDWIETDWFIIHNLGNQVEFVLPKILPAGRYGVMMHAYLTYLEQGEEFSHHVASAMFDIMYGDELRYFTATWGDDRSNVYNAMRYGRGRAIDVNIQTNQGAMDKGAIPYHEVHSGGRIFRMGTLFFDAEISFVGSEDVYGGLHVRIERVGGQQIGFINYWVSDEGLQIYIPSNLPSGRYIVRFWHGDPQWRHDGIWGSFVIDNVSSVAFNPPNLRWLVPFFFIFAILLLAGAIGLYVTPIVMVQMQQSKFAQLENARYMAGEGGKTDHHYKAQSANDSLKASRRKTGDNAADKAEEVLEERRETRGGGFLTKMHENKARREMAREAGLTMEEFRELEEQQNMMEESKKHSLVEFRRAVEEKSGVTLSRVEIEEEPEEEEKKPVSTPLRNASGDEFDMLDSVKSEAAFADEQFVQTVVQPNVQIQTQTTENQVPTGILDRIKQHTGGQVTTSMEHGTSDRGSWGQVLPTPPPTDDTPKPKVDHSDW